MTTSGAMTQGRIFRLWLPLETAWLLMAAEGPFMTAVLARMAQPIENLAAFGVALAFAMFFEAPIILIMSASTAMAEDRHSFLKLRRFTFALNAFITIAFGLFLLPPVFHWVTGTLMDLPPKVSALVHPACALLLLWPAAIGYRRFYQGVLIRNGLTKRVAFGTAVRLSSMAGTALLLSLTTTLPGALVGASAFSVGVLLEATASRFWARGPVRRLLETRPSQPSKAPLTYRAIYHFYLPLALTSILMTGVSPLVTFFLGRSRMPLESLAVLPVVNALTFIFVTGGLTFQEVAITLYGRDRAWLPALKRFASTWALIGSGGMILIAVSPLMGLWLRRVAGLPEDLTHLAAVPLIIASLQPAIATLLSFQRALLVVSRTTRPITWAAGIEVTGIAGLLFLLTQVAGWVGVVAAVSAMIISRFSSAVFLLPHTFRAISARSA